MSKISIFSKFGVTTAKPMSLVDLKESIPTVTGANQAETEATSDSCCDSDTDTPEE